MTIRIINCLVFIIIIFCAPAMCWAQLDAAYKEQYNQYNIDIERFQNAASKYSDCIERFEYTNSDILSLQRQIRQRIISREEATRMQIRIGEERLAILTEGLKIYNDLNSDTRQDISIQEIKNDLDRCRLSIKNATQRKQDLKLRILESGRTLPSWWTK